MSGPWGWFRGWFDRSQGDTASGTSHIRSVLLSYLFLIVFMMFMSITTFGILGLASVALRGLYATAHENLLLELEAIGHSFLDLVEVSVGAVIGALAASLQFSLTGKVEGVLKGKPRDPTYFIKFYLALVVLVASASFVVFGLFVWITLNISPESFPLQEKAIIDSIVVTFETYLQGFVDLIEVSVGGTIGALSATLNNVIKQTATGDKESKMAASESTDS